jgi:hypothetical protein
VISAIPDTITIIGHCANFITNHSSIVAIGHISTTTTTFSTSSTGRSVKKLLSSSLHDLHSLHLHHHPPHRGWRKEEEAAPDQR